MLKLYGYIRPILQRVGVLSFARRFLKPQILAAVARQAGLSEYVAPLPPRKRHQGAIQTDGVNYVADMRADIGIGESARAIYSALQAAGVATNYCEVEIPLIQRSAPVTETVNHAHYNLTVAHLNPPELHLGLARYPNAFHGCFVIGYWLWEVPRFPDHWRPRIQAVDEIWTASRYSQEILAREADVPVIYMPIPVEVSPEPMVRADFNLPNDRFIFLFVFNPGSSVARKNPYGVTEAYKRAFAGATEPPLLVIKAHHLKRHPQIEQELRTAVSDAGGVLIEDHFTRPQMHALITLANCVISLHRAEGFGLLMAEAMALGKPVIATGYSSNMDFMTESNSFPVRYKLREITEADHRDQPLFRRMYVPGQLWAEPDIDHAAELMRYAIDHPEEAQKRAAQAQHDLAAGWSYEAVGNRIKTRLLELAPAFGVDISKANSTR
jgi:glycosyltransferase involved in cell wall biosynthesis